MNKQSDSCVYYKIIVSYNMIMTVWHWRHSINFIWNWTVFGCLYNICIYQKEKNALSDFITQLVADDEMITDDDEWICALNSHRMPL